MFTITVEESITGTEFRDGYWFPTRTEYVVTVKDNGRTVMTFHTVNRDEADTIGPDLVKFLGYSRDDIAL